MREPEWESSLVQRGALGVVAGEPGEDVAVVPDPEWGGGRGRGAVGRPDAQENKHQTVEHKTVDEPVQTLNTHIIPKETRDNCVYCPNTTQISEENQLKLYAEYICFGMQPRPR